MNPLQNIRYAARVLLRTPGFTIVAVLTLALGIGANTAIFSVVSGVLLRPLPFAEPEELVQLQRQFREGQSPMVAIPKFLYCRDHNDVFEGVAAYDTLGSGFNITGEGAPERITGSRVSHEFFRVFGVQPALGRDFAPEEDRPGAPKVAILSHDLWKRRFGGERSILNQVVTLNGEGYRIVGVAPASFRYPATAELWTPAEIDPASQEKANYLEITARLKDGVSLEQAESAMKVVTERYRKAYPDMMGETESFAAVSLRERLYGRLRPALLVLLGAVGCVLLIACVNVANLQLARAAARRREIAVRTALGAGTSRIFGQLIMESLVLAMTGGAAGLLVGFWILKPLVALSPADALGPAGTAALPPLGIDARVMAFTFALSLAAGLLFGLMPALQAVRSNLREPLQEGTTRSTGGARGGLARRLLVVSEVALALILITGAALLTKSFAGLMRTDPGFEPEGVITMKLSLPEARYGDPEVLERFGRQLAERVEGLPGVRSASLASSLPMELGPDLPFAIMGKWPGGDSFEGAGNAQFRGMTPGYFEALGLRLVRGRFLGATDDAHSEPVALINEAAAREYWKGEDPLGARIRVGVPVTIELADKMPRRIVGIVKDVRESGLDEPPPPIIYVPAGQVAPPAVAMLVRLLPLSLVVKVEGSPEGLADSLRRQVWAIDPQQPVGEIGTMEQVVTRSLGSHRFNMLLMGCLALLALALAGVGIYGVLSYLVSQRTREIGVRMALGASARNVLRLVVGQGLAPVLIGVAIGLAGAFGLTRLLAGLLVGVSATDLTSFVLAPVVLTAVALLASSVPARRASRMDPLLALRRD
ncbi:MAG TPA: ABC transporter permease [Thermoanaerobaculia bacterium]